MIQNLWPGGAYGS